MESIGIFAPGVHSVRVEVGPHQYELFDERKLSPAKARWAAVALAGWLGLHRDDPARTLEPRFARRVRRKLLRFCGTVGLSSAALRSARVQVVGAAPVAGPGAPNGYAPVLSVAVGSVLPELVVEFRRAHPRHGQNDPRNSARGPFFARRTKVRPTKGQRARKGPDEPTDLEPPATRYEMTHPHDWDAAELSGTGDDVLL